MISRFMKVAAVVLASVVMMGCMESDTLVLVKKDGSGTISQTILMSQELLQMAESMSQMGATNDAAGKPAGIFDKEKFKAGASKLGQGVTFVSCEDIVNGKMKGVKAVYSFEDVSKLTLSQSPDMPEQPGMEDSSASAPKQDVTFQFTKLPVRSLILTLPQPDYTAPKDAVTEQAQIPPEQLEMIKQMYGNMSVKLRVQVDGDIKTTNASHVETTGGVKNTITLLEMDFAKLLNDPTALNKLAAMGNEQDMNKAKQTLKDLTGIKIETEKRVEIVF